jgi:uncharacterized membrane protein
MRVIAPSTRRRYLTQESVVPSDEQGMTALAQLGAALGGAMLIGASRRGTRGTVMRIAGAALLGYAIRPAIVRTLRETGARRRALSTRTTIDIDRPVPDVFAFFKDFECFPRIVGSLRSIVDFHDGRSRWEMYTPSGDIVAWDVVVTKYVPNGVIAWESVPGSRVEMRGVVRFQPLSPSSTQVSIELAFRPVHTGLSDAMYVLLRRQSQDRLAATMERVRYYIESFPSSLDDVAPTT